MAMSRQLTACWRGLDMLASPRLLNGLRGRGLDEKQQCKGQLRGRQDTAINCLNETHLLPTSQMRGADPGVAYCKRCVGESPKVLGEGISCVESVCRGWTRVPLDDLLAPV